MVTKLKEVDVVVVGLGWTGGILSKELAQAGLKVVALERGAMRSTEKDFSLPNIRDELRYVVRHDLMQNTARDTITVRNNPSQEALPMRRLGSFLPGEVVGGLVLRDRGHGDVQMPADHLGDLADGHALVGDRVQRRSRRNVVRVEAIEVDHPYRNA